MIASGHKMRGNQINQVSFTKGPVLPAEES